MSVHDWVCSNCHAQNMSSDRLCRVCGMDAPAGAYRGPTSESSAEKPHRTFTPTHTEGISAGLMVRNSKLYWLVYGLWIGLIAISVVQWVVDGPFWKLFEEHRVCFDMSRINAMFSYLGSILRHINPRYFGNGFERFNTILIQVFSGHNNMLLPYRNSSNSMIWVIAICSVWTLRLYIRCLRGVGRPARRYSNSFLRMAVEALGLNFLTFALSYLCLKSGAANVSSYMLNALFTLETIGIAVVLLALMLTDTLCQDTWPSGPEAGYFRPRMFRKDILQGLVMLTAFFAFTCLILA